MLSLNHQRLCRLPLPPQVTESLVFLTPTATQVCRLPDSTRPQPCNSCCHFPTPQVKHWYRYCLSSRDKQKYKTKKTLLLPLMLLARNKLTITGTLFFVFHQSRDNRLFCHNLFFYNTSSSNSEMKCRCDRLERQQTTNKRSRFCESRFKVFPALLKQTIDCTVYYCSRTTNLFQVIPGGDMPVVLFCLKHLLILSFVNFFFFISVFLSKKEWLSRHFEFI